MEYSSINKSTVSLNTTQGIALDDTDRRLLRVLSQNAKVSIQDLTAVSHLSATPTTRRVKRLEDLGIITGYHAHTDAVKLGYTLSVFVAVSMDRHTAERFAEFENAVRKFHEVVSCSVVTGRSEDYLLKVLVKDMAHYEEFLLHRLSKIEGVSQLHTSFELREVFSRAMVDECHL